MPQRMAPMSVKQTIQKPLVTYEIIVGQAASTKMMSNSFRVPLLVTIKG